ncbi:18S rRNA maturation protein [Aspergillus nanangensis]|uniref:rRNA-processing protein EFG1 n=1 Tax=Aspergillus nanangensis TaxID=2582783 RepID=A0AAD4GQQ3_ASPNN|nr:18S rRNA maturation protein [Aspergillus nanangensis]
MPRDYSRSRSPVSRPNDDRKYRDRTDRPKRKDREVSEDAPHHTNHKKIKLPKKEHQFPSINELKKRIRDVTRLLKKVDLPADVRIVQERALAGYEKDLEEETQRRHRSTMIKKYHFVRFLDRKTASKDVKNLQRLEQETLKADLDADSKQKKLSALTQKLHTARVNLNYTIYYPLAEKYIALYQKDTGKRQSNDDSDRDLGFRLIHTTEEEKPAMWRVVEKSMENGTLDLLREGKLTAPSQEDDDTIKQTKDKKKDKTKSKPTKPEDKKGKSAKQTKDHATTRVTPAENDGDESDGGFFEM